VRSRDDRPGRPCDRDVAALRDVRAGRAQHVDAGRCDPRAQREDARDRVVPRAAVHDYDLVRRACLREDGAEEVLDRVGFIAYGRDEADGWLHGVLRAWAGARARAGDWFPVEAVCARRDWTSACASSTARTMLGQ